MESPTALPAGKATVTLDFKYDGGGNGKGGVAKLSVNGKQVAEGRIEQTQGMMFSADETADVGLDNQDAGGSRNRLRPRRNEVQRQDPHGHRRGEGRKVAPAPAQPTANNKPGMIKKPDGSISTREKAIG